MWVVDRHLDVIWLLREMTVLAVVWLWVRVVVKEGRLSHRLGVCVRGVHVVCFKVELYTVEFSTIQ
jgi:hypothetical protein